VRDAAGAARRRDASIAAADANTLADANALADTLADTGPDADVMHLILALVLQRWIVLNDIHLNLFSRAGMTYGQDTTPALWESALREMRLVAPDARVVVLGGDMLTHHFVERAHSGGMDSVPAALATDRAIADALGHVFPRAQFLVTLGNNDDPCGDYRSETGGTFAHQLAAIWAPLVNRNGAAPDFASRFAHGGYYTARLPVAHGRAIVLNSVIWSLFYRGGCQSAPREPGAAELAWLQRTLSELPAGTNAMMLLHIPPGFDPQSTALIHRAVAIPFLKREANGALLATIADHERNLRFIIGAHTHKYDFRIAGGVPLLLASSLSPIYDNNPAFYTIEVDGEGNLHDVQPYVYDGSTGGWTREPTFDAMYGVRTINRATLTAITMKIQDDQATRTTWERAYQAWSMVAPRFGAHWQPFACAQAQLDADYAACAGTRGRAWLLGVMLAILAVIVAAAVLLIVRGRGTSGGVDSRA
jgi:hypothetical protein